MNQESLALFDCRTITMTSQNTGVLEQCLEHVRSPFKRDLTSMVGFLCCAPRRLRFQNTNLTGPAPHNWGDHITHPALALGDNAHASQGIGMTGGRQRQPASD